MEPVTLLQFYELLSKHDWYYDWSDDRSIWARGKSSLVLIQGIAAQSQEHLALFNGFKKHYFTGRPWNNEQAPKPEKPKE